MAAGDLPDTGDQHQQILERERRWARPVAIASVLAVVFYLGSIIIETSGGLVDRDDDATRLLSFHDNETALLGTAILLAIGALLMAAPLFYLFKAAQARSDKVRSSFIAFAFIGPALFAVQGILSWFALTDVADEFVAMSQQTDQVAEDLIEDSSALQTATGLIFPAILGLLVAMIYIPLMAMRQGLITRFFGTLGMALGACLALFPPIALLGLMMWFVYIGLMVGGWLPGGRPPAWETGEATPWPRPGDQHPEPRPDDPRGGSIPAVEGSGREVSEPPLPEEATPEEPGETQGRRRKKRKRR